MAKSNQLQEAQNPLILRFHRLLDAFSKSDDERDFYLDRQEGFLIFADLDKNDEDLATLENELKAHQDRYVMVPKMSFFETKKFMEGFVNEKVYDIDTKEKLLDIISGKEARDNFLEFIYDHVTEMERWQQYYHERSRIRIIEWLRAENVVFVFEEDLDLPKPIVEKLKRNLFEAKVSKDLSSAREALRAKSRSYYSSEALNPRPKRGRPPKQQQKVELEPQLTPDIYTTVPQAMRSFLFMPDYTSTVIFSAKYDTEAQFLASLKGTTSKVDTKLEALSQRLESLRHLSERLRGSDDLGAIAEEKLFKAFSKTDEEENRVFGLARELLPKKKEKSADGEEEAPKKQTPGIKRVSQIKRTKK